MKRKIFFALGFFVLVVIILILNIFQGKKEKEVSIDIVKLENIREIVKGEGFLEAKEQVEIGSLVLGRIEKIYVKEGEKVKRGALLCLIDPGTYIARKEEIKSRLEIDLSRLLRTEKEFLREKELFEKELISASEYERIESEYKSLLAQVKSDSFSLKEAEENLRKCYISSPIDGEVLKINKKRGEMAVAGAIGTPGTVIMVIANKSKMLVKGEIDETEVPKIKNGNLSEISLDAFPFQKFDGKVTRVGGLPKEELNRETSVTFPVDIELEQENSLFQPGMSASFEIITQKKDSVPVLSYIVLGKEKDGENSKYFIFILKNKKIEKRYVVLGIHGQEKVEIKQGIQKGDTIVSGPLKILKTLKQGERVKIKKEIKEKNFKKWQ